jgi:hypothetical protein
MPRDAILDQASPIMFLHGPERVVAVPEFRDYMTNDLSI